MLTPPTIGRWTPTRTISVVIPARGHPEGVAATLAALAAQTYPAHLVEVVVVDDHSRPPLAPPPLRPERCRVETAPAGGWGAGHARAYGAHVTSGDILCWLDAGLTVGPAHLEAHARWQHAHAECVTVGRVRPALPPQAAAAPGAPGVPQGGPGHFDHLGFTAYTGASAALRRSLYEAAGGVDPALDLGQDTEFGYRLWQAGALLVPEPAADAHRCAANPATRTRVPSPRYHREVLAELMPHPRTHRAPLPAHRRRVPLVRAVVDAAGGRYETVRGCVDRLLEGGEDDLAVTLVADWDAGVGAADAPALDLRLLQAAYLGDPRVRFAAIAPRTGFPSPYLLEVPAGWGLGPTALAGLLARAERSRAGLTELVPDPPAAARAPVRLWTTRALTRALRVRTLGEDPADVVAELHGRYRVRAGGGALVDLDGPPPPRTPGLPGRPAEAAGEREGGADPDAEAGRTAPAAPAGRGPEGPLRRMLSALRGPFRRRGR
nr:glycosyltransferase family A protein [Nocardiopsis trehalosi]